MRKKRKARRSGIKEWSGIKLPVPFVPPGNFTRRELTQVTFVLSAFLFVLSSMGTCLGQAKPPVVGAPGTNTNKSITGTVLDEHGSPVPHAIVLLKDLKTLQIRSYIAQNDGSYHFYDLSGDINYELRAESNGLTSKEQIVSVFNSHKLVKLNLKLNKKLKT
jgi:hypothetical protein